MTVKTMTLEQRLAALVRERDWQLQQWDEMGDYEQESVRQLDREIWWLRGFIEETRAAGGKTTAPTL